eukprot:7728852-Pyramimonas_sp.AAC.1
MHAEVPSGATRRGSRITCVLVAAEWGRTPRNNFRLLSIQGYFWKVPCGVLPNAEDHMMSRRALYADQMVCIIRRLQYLLPRVSL